MSRLAFPARTSNPFSVVSGSVAGVALEFRVRKAKLGQLESVAMP